MVRQASRSGEKTHAEQGAMRQAETAEDAGEAIDLNVGLCEIKMHRISSRRAHASSRREEGRCIGGGCGGGTQQSGRVARESRRGCILCGRRLAMPHRTHEHCLPPSNDSACAIMTRHCDSRHHSSGGRPIMGTCSGLRSSASWAIQSAG